jgi:hypothetical protein
MRLVLLPLLLASATAQAAMQMTSGGPPQTGAPPRAPAPGQSGTGAISGVVSDGTTGRPIAGALVYLGIQARGPVGERSRQITDAKGRFVFTDLPESDRFFLNASKAGYQNGRYGDSGPISAGIGSGLIALTRGQWFSAANMALWRPGAIAGVVRDERGEPMVNVYVRALSRVRIAGTVRLAAGAVARTDDRGRYRLSGLLPGTYLVSVPSVQTAVPAETTAATIEGLARADAPLPNVDARRNQGALPLQPGHLLIVGNYPAPPVAGGRPQAYPIAFHPGTTSILGATAIELEPGETREQVDVNLRPSPAVRVSGRVVAPPESIRGLVLRLVGEGLDDLGEGSEVATTLVAPTGEFTFLNVPAGAYTLVASKSLLEYSYGPARSASLPGTPGLVPGPGGYLGGVASGPPGTRSFGTHAAGDVRYFARMPLVVGESDVLDVGVTMRPTVTLRGRVEFEGDGDPPAAMTLIAEPADGSAWLGLQHSRTRPSPGETFEIEGLMPGEYVLRAVGLSPRQAIKSIVSGAIDYTTRPFDAAAGQDFDVVVTYTDRVASLTGRVADAARPISVLAFPASRDQWTRYGLSAARFKMAPVANDGSYRIENIPAGSYLLVAVDTAQSSRRFEPAFLEAAAQSASPVTVGWGETRSVDLNVSAIK